MKKVIQLLVCLTIISTLNSQTPSNLWTPQAIGLLPDKHRVLGISIVNKDVAWAVVDSNFSGNTIPLQHVIKVLKTTNAGTTWQLYKLLQVAGRISFDIQAIDSSVAFVTTQDYGNGLGRALYKTTDGGNTWTSKFKGVDAGVWLRFYNAQNAIMWNRQGYARSQDGGETWVSRTFGGFNSDEFTVLESGTNSCFVVGDTIWGGTSQSRIVRSPDKGVTWQFLNLQSVPNFGSNVYILSVAFKDARNGIALGWNSVTFISYLARTTDGGNTWTNITTYPFTYGANIEYIGGTAGSFLLCDYDGLTTYTTNFGQSWVKVDSLESNTIRFLNAQTGWVGKSRIGVGDPALYKWTGGNILSSLKIFEPQEVSLKISPNPTSRFLTVEYSPDFKPTTLTIYDVEGKAVFEKSNLPKSSQIIDLQSLVNGVYLVQLRNKEGYISRKILVQR